MYVFVCVDIYTCIEVTYYKVFTQSSKRKVFYSISVFRLICTYLPNPSAKSRVWHKVNFKEK